MFFLAFGMIVKIIVCLMNAKIIQKNDMKTDIGVSLMCCYIVIPSVVF